ncbi:hypothetical protein KSE_76040t [Kitasatospora setae KM-6054]|uniref:Uncharacterized protein n=1 Tax=Kitasatospora setae (strain ATCC 33774 / DSM 43861 / JCM 3304 / KCC A-0304 / NBRC 14216 / KM-6054) TaxID=452652 RepID=E4MZ29_KITSK|nr:hypothetical protein KSE_00700t [Kitasatospora setae KM-6054]BAJ33356.1 hypothetical protein KSE_76040t [Kitasatospora setae KM-6054]
MPPYRRPSQKEKPVNSVPESATGTVPASAGTAALPHVTALLRHFGDLRDGSHGEATSRRGKEDLFLSAVALLAPYALEALEEVNAHLLNGTGKVEGTGVRRTADGGVAALWTLSWPEQRSEGIEPITLAAHYGRNFHHPHLRGATVGEWPLNVFTPAQAKAELPTLRAIITADLHNLVFQRDFRIVPATMAAVGSDHTN